MQKPVLFSSTTACWRKKNLQRRSKSHCVLAMRLKTHLWHATCLRDTDYDWSNHCQPKRGSEGDKGARKKKKLRDTKVYRDEGTASSWPLWQQDLSPHQISQQGTNEIFHLVGHDSLMNMSEKNVAVEISPCYLLLIRDTQLRHKKLGVRSIHVYSR